jgi:hypothetical protein
MDEAEALRLYQSKTQCLCPLMGEIIEPLDPPSIALQYLGSELRAESDEARLSRSDTKLVAKMTLQALAALHKDGMVQRRHFAV